MGNRIWLFYFFPPFQKLLLTYGNGIPGHLPYVKTPGFMTYCRQDLWRGGLISNFSSSHLRSKQEERRGPLVVSRAGLQDPNPGSPKRGPRPGGAAPLLIKEQLVGAAATIYLIKTGYSGAILRYVNECYIIDIY